MIKTGLLAAGVVAGVIVLGAGVTILTQPFTTASGVISRTMNPDNVLRSYELFHDRWTGYEARIRQAAVTATDLAAEIDPAERNRLRVELGAQRQSCREIAAAYNADVAKTNRVIFRGREAPESLDMNRC